jgi:hypothetical protein
MASCPQRGQVMTDIKTMRGLLLDRPGRREAALISTSDGKRIISQLVSNIPNLATIHPESNCYVSLGA